MTTTSKPNTSFGPSTNEGAPTKGGGVDIVNDVKEIAGDAAGQAKQIADNQITLRKDKALDTLGNVAQALRETSGRLGSQKETVATDYVMRAADGVDRVAQYLRSRDLSRVVQDVESFARREPAIFLGGAFVAGLIGSRFLKSSGAPTQAMQQASQQASQSKNGNRPRVETGPRTATGGAWPSEGGPSPRPRGEGISSPLQSGSSDTRSNLAETRNKLGVGGPSGWTGTPGGAGGSSTSSGTSTPGGSGQPIVNQTDVKSTQPKSPSHTPVSGAPQGKP